MIVALTAPSLAFASGSGAVELSSLSSGTVLLALGLALSFLAPVVIAVFCLAGGQVDSERSESEATAANATRRERSSSATTEESTNGERTISTRSGRSER